MQYLSNAAACADAIIKTVGKDLRVGAQLACGKPNHILNALYRRAKADPNLKLSIMTALSLEKPKGKSDLEKRFIEPLAERIFANYPDLEYELDRMKHALPENVKIIEFYFPAGKYMHVHQSQKDYISSNYTHVVRDLLARGLNVLVQQVAKAELRGEGGFEGLHYSLSCNADLSLDVLDAFRQLRAAGQTVISAVQVNEELPFMFGDAVVEPEVFDLIVDEPQEYYRPFGPPKAGVGDAEYMIGLHGSTLIRDGGELQIGIGALGDALTYSMVLRQTDNDKYRAALGQLGIADKFASCIEEVGGLGPFAKGLFGSSEMMVDGFLNLIQAKILKRKVYDDLSIQRLLNDGSITEKVTPGTVEALLQVRAIRPQLTVKDYLYLKKWGILQSSIAWDDGKLRTPEGDTQPADLANERSRDWIYENCLGDRLANGSIVHAGFFLGPQSFYEALRSMPEDERLLISMRSVTKVNQLFGHEDIDRLHRRDARFVNTCLAMTLLGGAASETLEDGRVVSGIGGQYNFVSMAHALPGGRSILNLRSTRGAGSKTRSNLVWTCGNLSIPRHLRDLVVTEYGIARLRSKTDNEVIAELLNVADSRFQPELLAEAKKQKKISERYEIPEAFRNNYPETYHKKLKELKKQGLFPRFPFGTDLTEEEQVLSLALKRLKAKTQSKGSLMKSLGQAVASNESAERYRPYLERMQLYPPKNLVEKVYARLIINELAHLT